MGIGSAKHGLRVQVIPDSGDGHQAPPEGFNECPSVARVVHNFIQLGNWEISFPVGAILNHLGSLFLLRI